MMNRRIPRFILAGIVGLMAGTAWAVQPGNPAPDFTAQDTHGQIQTLAQYKGKYVVLEWHNRECPYTHKHYMSGNMQRLQREWTAKGVVWFTVISSAPGQQGYMTADQENAYLQEVGASPTAVLLDPTGQLGHLYGAKNTPHVFVISPAGVLIYDGAIDDKSTADPDDIASAHNYVSAALQEAMTGKPVSTPVTRPYGCSVKYAR
ncbi:MAG: redoxin domain-containing protein [Terriglobia bacterium]